MSTAPNPADPPSPANRYRIPERAHATSDLFNLILSSIGARLDAAELKSADYDVAIDRIIGQALETVSTALTVEIEAGRAEFEAVRAAFEELQSGGFSAARIAATLTGQAGVRDVQAALTRLLDLISGVDLALVSRLNALEPIATDAEARAGTEASKRMPPNRVAAAIDALAGAEQTLNVTANQTAVRNKRYRLIGTLVRTITLPANPVSGDTIGFCDGGTTANHTIARNGRTIMGLADNLILDQRGYNFTLWWAPDSTWRLF